MAFSTDGRTSLASFGFSGCLGVVISPTSGKGGLVYHIHQMRGVEEHEDQYLRDAIVRCLRFARERGGWRQVDMVLVRGQVTDEDDPGSIKHPRLVQMLRDASPGDMAMVRDVADLRAQTLPNDTQRPSNLLLDTDHHVLHLWGAFPPGFTEHVEEDTERPEIAVVERGDFTPAYTKPGMPATRWFRFG
jgi:hypothetical protein